MNSISALSVLHFCPRPSYSGLEAYALDMAAGQQNLGARIQFVVLKDSPLAEKCKARSIKTIEIGSDLVSRWVFRGQLARLLRSGEIDIVHLHSTQDLDLVLLSLARGLFCKPTSGSVTAKKIPCTQSPTAWSMKSGAQAYPHKQRCESFYPFLQPKSACSITAAKSRKWKKNS